MIENDIKIRLANENDFLDIFNIEKECFKDFYSIDTIIRDINSKNHIVLLAYNNLQIAGYLTASFVLDECTLERVAVNHIYRNKKIASRLIDELIKNLNEKICTIYLEVRKSNTIAQKLYDKKGFLQIGVRSGYYPDNKEDALIYKLII